MTPRPDRFWGTLSLLSKGYRRIYPGVKRPVREGNYSPPSSDEVKNAWSYTSSPTVRLHDTVLS
jgi:hypothetical protein